ncbi:sigma-70 family RNA polymerase sigma factor [Chloroflexota bacterium]
MNIDRGRASSDERKHRENMLSDLYQEYYDKISHYAYARIGNRAEAEDIAGEVFLRALKSLGSYQERDVPMQAWLFKIAHNLVIDYFRKTANQKTVPIDDLPLRSKDNPQAIAEKNIELERVKKAMQYLTEEQREVVNLRFFGGLTSKESGQLLKKSDGAVREMQRAAIEKLRTLLTVNRGISGE